MIDLKNYKLYAYGDICLKADIEESIDDIEIAVGYHNHGDHYIYVKTKEGATYDYGCFFNLKFEDNYENINEAKYLRVPEMFSIYEDSKTHILSNELYFRFEELFQKSHMSFGFDKIVSKEEAQYLFDSGIRTLESAFKTGKYFNKDRYKKDFLYFLEKNGIDSEKNLEILDNAHFSSRINGYDGIAGKRVTSEKTRMYQDGFDFIIVNGKEIPFKNTIIIRDDDDEGFEYQMLDLRQFAPGYSNRIRQEAEERRSELIAKLKKLDFDNMSTSQILRQIDNLREAIITDMAECDEDYYSKYYGEEE